MTNQIEEVEEYKEDTFLIIRSFENINEFMKAAGGIFEVLDDLAEYNLNF